MRRLLAEFFIVSAFAVVLLLVSGPPLIDNPSASSPVALNLSSAVDRATSYASAQSPVGCGPVGFAVNHSGDYYVRLYCAGAAPLGGEGHVDVMSYRVYRVNTTGIEEVPRRKRPPYSDHLPSFTPCFEPSIERLQHIPGKGLWFVLAKGGQDVKARLRVTASANNRTILSTVLNTAQVRDAMEEDAYLLERGEGGRLLPISDAPEWVTLEEQICGYTDKGCAVEKTVTSREQHSGGNTTHYKCDREAVR